MYIFMIPENIALNYARLSFFVQDRDVKRKQNTPPHARIIELCNARIITYMIRKLLRSSKP